MGIFTDADTEGLEEYEDILKAFEHKFSEIFKRGYKQGLIAMRQIQKGSYTTRNVLDRVKVLAYPTNYTADPLKAPHEFGYCLGISFGLLKFLPGVLLQDDETYKIFVNYMNKLKSVEGFDFNIVKKRLMRFKTPNSAEMILKYKKLLREI